MLSGACSGALPSLVKRLQELSIAKARERSRAFEEFLKESAKGEFYSNVSLYSASELKRSFQLIFQIAFSNGQEKVADKRSLDCWKCIRALVEGIFQAEHWLSLEEAELHSLCACCLKDLVKLIGNESISTFHADLFKSIYAIIHSQQCSSIGEECLQWIDLVLQAKQELPSCIQLEICGILACVSIKNCKLAFRSSILLFKSCCDLTVVGSLKVLELLFDFSKQKNLLLFKQFTAEFLAAFEKSAINLRNVHISKRICILFDKFFLDHAFLLEELFEAEFERGKQIAFAINWTSLSPFNLKDSEPFVYARLYTSILGKGTSKALCNDSPSSSTATNLLMSPKRAKFSSESNFDARIILFFFTQFLKGEIYLETRTNLSLPFKEWTFWLVTAKEALSDSEVEYLWAQACLLSANSTDVLVSLMIATHLFERGLCLPSQIQKFFASLKMPLIKTHKIDLECLSTRTNLSNFFGFTSHFDVEIVEIFTDLLFANLRESNWKQAYLLLKTFLIGNNSDGEKYSRILFEEFTLKTLSSLVDLPALVFLSGCSINLHLEAYRIQVIESAINLYENLKRSTDSLFESSESKTNVHHLFEVYANCCKNKELFSSDFRSMLHDFYVYLEAEVGVNSKILCPIQLALPSGSDDFLIASFEACNSLEHFSKHVLPSYRNELEEHVEIFLHYSHSKQMKWIWKRSVQAFLLIQEIEIPIYSPGQRIAYGKDKDADFSIYKSYSVEIVSHLLLRSVMNAKPVDVDVIRGKNFFFAELQRDLHHFIAHFYSLLWEEFPKKMNAKDIFAAFSALVPHLNQQNFNHHLLLAVGPLFEYFDSIDAGVGKKREYWEFIQQANDTPIKLQDLQFSSDSPLGIVKFLTDLLVHSSENSPSLYLAAILEIGQKFKIPFFSSKIHNPNPLTCFKNPNTVISPQDSIKEFLPKFYFHLLEPHALFAESSISPVKRLLFIDYEFAFAYGAQAIAESIGVNKQFFFSLYRYPIAAWKDWRVCNFLLLIASKIGATHPFSPEQCEILCKRASELNASKEHLYWHEKFTKAPLKQTDEYFAFPLSFLVPQPDPHQRIENEFYNCWKHDRWDIPFDYRDHCGYSNESLNSLLFSIAKRKSKHVEYEQWKSLVASQMQFDSPFIIENPFFDAASTILSDSKEFPFSNKKQTKCSSLLLEFKAKDSSLDLEKHIKFCLRTKDFSKAFTQIANLSSAALRCLYTGKSLWKMGESRKAVSVLVQGLNDNLDSDSFCSKLAYLKCKWSIKLKLERPSETISTLTRFCLSGHNDSQNTKAKFLVAQLSKNTFLDFTARQNIEAKESSLEKKKEKIRLFSASPKDPMFMQLKSQYAIENAELMRLKEERLVHLMTSIRFFCELLAEGAGKHEDASLFSLVSLWLGEFSLVDGSFEVQNLLSLIPISKFLQLSYQLFAKFYSLCNGEATSSSCLRYICKGLFDAFPKNVFWQVFAIFKSIPLTLRIRVVEDPLFAQITTQLEFVASSLIQFALEPVNEEATQQSTVRISPKLSISKIKDLEHVPVLTANAKDSNIPFITAYSKTFRVIGGMNLPKVIECFASDGRVYKQLVKGKDDLRQDAVTEQVFHLVNRLILPLKDCTMRTYRIVPLHPIAGIIEWVDNAIPLGNWLTPRHEGNKTQMHPNECRRLMNELLEQKASPKEKLRVFTQQILPNYKPCLRNFFIETFPTIDQWYQARILYAKSLATSSIVGYLVGLGDRHPQNILLDRLTGELIHIDLNLIFEQGRLLKVPEHVPFRMTQELIDGLGALPFDGEPFLPTAEATWDLLKENSEKILTILQVFKHDPLHRWTVGQAKLQKLNPNPMLCSQQPAVETHSKDEAERVLTRIKEKLAGIEEGCPLSTAGHVNFLLRIATDNEILCQMYPGWQPWN